MYTIAIYNIFTEDAYYDGVKYFLDIYIFWCCYLPAMLLKSLACSKCFKTLWISHTLIVNSTNLFLKDHQRISSTSSTNIGRLSPAVSSSHHAAFSSHPHYGPGLPVHGPTSQPHQPFSSNGKFYFLKCGALLYCVITYCKSLHKLCRSMFIWKTLKPKPRTCSGWWCKLAMASLHLILLQAYQRWQHSPISFCAYHVPNYAPSAVAL